MSQQSSLTVGSRMYRGVLGLGLFFALAWLLEHDPVYRNVAQLPPDLQSRERTFLGNTLRVMIGYVAGRPAAERSLLTMA